MNNSRMKTTAVLLTTVFMLAGCNEGLYELTPEEEAVVVNYAAHAVAKYNTYQQDGEVFVYKEVLEGTEETEDADATEAETEPVLETESEEEVHIAKEPEDQEDTGTSAADAAQSFSTLTEALDLGVVEASYADYTLCTTFKQSDSYTVDAAPGKQLLVMNIRLKNTIDQPLHIDILAMTPTFRAVLNNTDTYAAQTTILLNDLSTYQADIEASAVDDTVLVFEIPQDVTDISDLQLKVTMNNKNFDIEL